MSTKKALVKPVVIGNLEYDVRRQPSDTPPNTYNARPWALYAGENEKRTVQIMFRKQLLRYRLAAQHMDLVRSRDFITARYLLILLNRGRVSIGLDANSAKAECILSDYCKCTYGRNYNTVTFYLNPIEKAV